MTDLITNATEDDLHEFVAKQIFPMMVSALEKAGTGQRLRVTSLPPSVMRHICQKLQGDTRWSAKVLTDEISSEDWQATPTKIIELRNTLEQPLLVFIPQGLRNAAEDSLDIATFTELSMTSVANDLVESLLKEVEKPLHDAMREMLGRLRLEKFTRHADEEVQYLLTVKKNGGTPESAGGALYALGLIPDFALFTRGSHIQWLSRNQAVCGFLGDIAQPLQSRLARLRVTPNTLQPDLFRFLRDRQSDDIRIWAKHVACDQRYRHLAFDRWQFSDTLNEQELRLILEPLTLPVQGADVVPGAVRLPVLNLAGKDVLKVAFRSAPKPSQYPSWKHFRIQILSVEDEGPSVAWESNNYPRTSGPNARITRSVRVTDLQFLEEGTYYVKVEAYDTDGALLNASPRLIDPEDATSRAENESERFLVLREDTIPQPADSRSVLVSSLLDGWMHVAAKALGRKTQDELPSIGDANGAWDEPVGAAPRSDVHFELESPGFAGLAISVPSLLRKIQLAILQNPKRIGKHYLSLSRVRSAADVELNYDEDFLPDNPLVNAFFNARAEVCRSILRDHIAEGADSDELTRRAGIVETVNLLNHQAAIDKYVDAYVKLGSFALEAGGANGIRPQAIASLDLVELRWRSSVGDPGRALLLSPTHPLRLAWHLAHARLCANSIKSWSDSTHAVPSWRRFIGQLRNDLIPSNLPLVVFDRKGRGYVEHTPLTPFWPLYLPDRGMADAPLDAAAARDRIISAMGMGNRSVALSTVSSEDIATRLFEYLQQHPYAEQLRLNVFNPGDGRFVADVLRAVERRRISIDKRNAPALRYAVHLFAATNQLDLVADGLEALLDPERQVSEDDEFTLASSNHLLPKLVFARNTIEEFLQAPERYAAHVSILHEQFIAHSRVARVDHLRRGSFVSGLVQEPQVQIETSGQLFGWTKGLRAEPDPSSSGPDTGAALAVMQCLGASVALGKTPAPGFAPVIALNLDPNAQALLRRVHDYSDWVVTIDRNLGLDYFDSPSAANEAGYLLDFAPEYLNEDRQRLLLTTRSTIELEGLIRPALSRFELLLSDGDEAVVLEAIRSLSGRLALRFESARTHSSEVVGLLLARWLLERVGILSDRIVIPLDAHRSWFRREEAEQEVSSQKRADLLLVGFGNNNTLRLDIVEVKLRTELAGSTARIQLYRNMYDQVENTEARIRELFDPHYYALPRADFALKAKELGTILSFYVRRAVRYELLTKAAGESALAKIERLDQGYQFDIRSLGVVFERAGIGTHEDEEEPGFRVYRFGGDVAQQLLSFAVKRHTERVSKRSSVADGRRSYLEPSPAPAISNPELESFRSLLAVPLVERPTLAEIELPPTAANEIVHTAEEPEAEASFEATNDWHPSSNRPYTPINTPQAGTDTLGVADILLGASDFSPQFGVLGKSADKTVAIDLNGCNTISLFGVQGFGKSYTLGAIAEMATTPVPGINLLPSPLATVIFHYHKSDAYEPEHAAAIHPNQKQSEVERLLSDYGARPKGLQDVVLLVPAAKVEQRRGEYPGVDVEPIQFSSAELGAESWKYLLGAYGNDSLYVRQLVAIMRRHRGDLTLDVFRREIEAAELSKGARQLAEDRIRLAEPYIDDSKRMGQLLRPGRTVIVDLRDEWIEKDEALGLFVVMLRIFSAQRHESREFNKLVVFDEAHKYMAESALIGQVVETIREMRHQATSVVIASQDPLSVPRAVVELTSVLILHRMTSPQWLKHLKGAIAALDEVNEAQLAALKPGEALIWAQRSTDKRYTIRPQKLVIRPRFSQHGGGTRTAVSGSTVR